jgi:hypothetical protein
VFRIELVNPGNSARNVPSLAPPLLLLPLIKLYGLGLLPCSNSEFIPASISLLNIWCGDWSRARPLSRRKQKLKDEADKQPQWPAF